MLQACFDPSGVILDVDGVLWVAGAPTRGAVTFLDSLRQAKVPFCLLTNDCSVSKAERQEALRQAGLIVQSTQLLTAAEVTREWLQGANVRTIMYLGVPDVLSDVATGLQVREIDLVDAVVVGDLFAYYDRRSLDKAAKAICNGAALVAIQRNPRWFDGEDWYVDNGFWVAGLEYVTGQPAIVTGKPSRDAYLTAVNRLGLSLQTCGSIAFVSDDLMAELRGAKDVGLVTVYFGISEALPPWVDYVAHDIDALASILFNNDRN